MGVGRLVNGVVRPGSATDLTHWKLHKKLFRMGKAADLAISYDTAAAECKALIAAKLLTLHAALTVTMHACNSLHYTCCHPILYTTRLVSRLNTPLMLPQ